MRLHLLAGLIAAGAITPAAALGAGYPAPGMDTTRTGATAPGDPFRYAAYPGGGTTVVTKVARAGGEALRHRRLAGAWTVAPVALDASTTGLSADGATLVLITPRRSRAQATTRFLVLDTLTLRPTRRLTLRGDFTLDGVSPDGRRLFVVQYRDATVNPLDYAVRVYDVPGRRLLPGRLVDPRHPTEKMTGFPMSRALSPDDRWAYTLYGGGSEQFVHALDTARARAYCIDLRGLADDLGSLRLSAHPGHVDLVGPAGIVRRIDTATLKVSTPPAPRPDPGAKATDATRADAFPWALAAVVLALGALALVALVRRGATRRAEW